MSNADILDELFENFASNTTVFKDQRCFGMIIFQTGFLIGKGKSGNWEKLLLPCLRVQEAPTFLSMETQGPGKPLWSNMF